MTNAERFITSYNKIDKALRNIYGYKTYLNFTDIVRRSAAVNYVVKKYEQKLVDYARLRNAIVHQTDFERIIAEPHLDVVEDFEAIGKLICTPPKALDNAIAKGKITTIDAEAKLVDVIKIIHSSGFSNIPVLEDRKFIGVVNNKFIVESIAQALEKGKCADEFLKITKVGKILSEDMMNVYYVILDENATLVDVMDKFEKNRKLVAVVFTKNGNSLESLLGMITASDLVDVSDILDNYE